MTEYTSEDFKNARFAEHENGRAAARKDDAKYPLWFVAEMGEPWFMEDHEMAESGWRPVHESAPLTLDALREAWENAEVPTKDNPIREGDELIVKHREEDWEWVAICPGSDSENWISDARILRRAPQPEPWADLADVLAVEMPGIEDEPRIEALAKALYCEHDVRVTDGDES